MELGRAADKPSVRIEALSLWESLSHTPSDVPVTPAQLVELDRRSEALDRDVEEGNALGVPWDEVVRQLRARR